MVKKESLIDELRKEILKSTNYSEKMANDICSIVYGKFKLRRSNKPTKKQFTLDDLHTGMRVKIKTGNIGVVYKDLYALKNEDLKKDNNKHLLADKSFCGIIVLQEGWLALNQYAIERIDSYAIIEVYDTPSFSKMSNGFNLGKRLF